MNKRFAVMDLGTNTFHLLIAEGNTVNFKPLVHQHIGVKLGEGGINKGIILPAAFERGINTMKNFSIQIANYKVKQIKAIATSALRNASNGLEFINRVRSETNIEIEIIDGNQEATFIYRGIKASNILSAQNSLIIDIGGGSVEFIIANKEQLLWKQSFEIGAARLMEKFHHADPISPESIKALELYLENTLTDLFATVKEIPVNNIIGSSGAFETYAELIELKKNNTFDLEQTKVYHFDEKELLDIIEQLILSSHADRSKNKGIIPVRVDMIVVASLITRYMIQKLNIHLVSLCTYSLKEGILAELMS